MQQIDIDPELFHRGLEDFSYVAINNSESSKIQDEQLFLEKVGLPFNKDEAVGLLKDIYNYGNKI